MKKKVYILIAVFITSCIRGEIAGNIDDNNSAKIIENNTSAPGTEFRQERFSEQELDKMKHNYELLIPHIKINDDSMSYILDISKEEAMRIGVDKEYYDLTIESIKATNEALKDAFDNGIEVDMYDFKDIVKPATK